MMRKLVFDMQQNSNERRRLLALSRQLTQANLAFIGLLEQFNNRSLSDRRRREISSGRARDQIIRRLHVQFRRFWAARGFRIA